MEIRYSAGKIHQIGVALNTGKFEYWGKPEGFQKKVWKFDPSQFDLIGLYGSPSRSGGIKSIGSIIYKQD